MPWFLLSNKSNNNYTIVYESLIIFTGLTIADPQQISPKLYDYYASLILGATL